MGRIEDTFPPPALDAVYWNEQVAGGGTIVPNNGVFVAGIANPGDAAYVDSHDKMILPANRSADVSVLYTDTFVDPADDILTFLGWRSLWLNAAGEPRFGVDIILRMQPLPAVPEIWTRTYVEAAVAVAKVVDDPLAGNNGGFRLIRNKYSTQLYQYEQATATWTLIQTVDLAYAPPACVLFGQYNDLPANTCIGSIWMP